MELRLRAGKADFVKKQLPDGTTEEVCLLKYNADLSKRGCINQVPGELIAEVRANNGHYSEETIERYMSERRKLPDLRCLYCYDRRKNNERVTPVTIGEKTIKDFEEFKPKFVRLGKSTEAGHELYLPLLIHFLEICRDYSSQAIFPTKDLAFNEAIAKLLRETKSVVNFSIGHDKMELGACSQGYTNAWRIEQAKRYFESGVNATLTITCDVTSSIAQNASRGFALEHALNAPFPAPRRLLPLRITSNEVAIITTGKTMQQLTYRRIEHTAKRGYQQISGLENCLTASDEEGAKLAEKPYFRIGNQSLIPAYLHPDFQQFAQQKRICGKIGDYEHCDKCTLCPPIEPFHISSLVKVKYSKDRKVGWDRYRTYKIRKRSKLAPDIPGIFEV